MSSRHWGLVEAKYNKDVVSVVVTVVNLVLKVLFFGALILDDVFADVLIVVLTFIFAAVDVLVAKVMEFRVFWRLSSGARSS